LWFWRQASAFSLKRRTQISRQNKQPDPPPRSVSILKTTPLPELISTRIPACGHRAVRLLSGFIFGAVDGRAVARDIFLDGSTFRDSRSVNKEPFVADISAGVGLIAGRWQANYTGASHAGIRNPAGQLRPIRAQSRFLARFDARQV
jgi:hypothetical protein